MAKGSGNCDTRLQIGLAGDNVSPGLNTKNIKEVAKATIENDVPSLIPLGDEYIQNEMNVLLISEHGTGKTESVIQLAQKHGLELKYYSCATLDPYTDLVGVPFPEENEDGTRFLSMLRPREMDTAQIIFFDELNRASSKTLAAVFEITQFGTINGEPLPNLKMVWGAINPPSHEQEYQVEELDPAFEDRFDAYINIQPSPSVAYMEQFVPTLMAKALKQWWEDHNKKRRGANSYISPRRLLKIGLAYHKIGSDAAIFQSLPMGGRYDSKKLAIMLSHAKEGKAYKPEDHLGDGANEEFEYTPNGIYQDRKEISEFLKENPLNLETHKAIVKALKDVKPSKLMSTHPRVLNSLQPTVLESMLVEMDSDTLSELREKFDAKDDNAKKYFPQLEKTLHKLVPTPKTSENSGQPVVKVGAKPNGKKKFTGKKKSKTKTNNGLKVNTNSEEVKDLNDIFQSGEDLNTVAQAVEEYIDDK